MPERGEETYLWKVLIVGTEPESRRTLSAMVTQLMSVEKKPQVAILNAPEQKTFEQRVRERIAAIEAGVPKDVRSKELYYLRRWLGQGPRKEPRLEVHWAEDVCVAGIAMRVEKLKRDGTLRVLWSGQRPEAGRVLTIKGHPYHVAWAKDNGAEPGKFRYTVGLKPGAPPPEPEPHFGEQVVCKTPADVERHFGTRKAPAPRVSLKKKWKAQHLRKIEETVNRRLA